MFILRLKAKECISCGICMDVCPLRAISMQTRNVRSVEGPQLTFLRLEPASQGGHSIERFMTFPYMARPELCDGCGLCLRECPSVALELSVAGEIPASRHGTGLVQEAGG